MYEGRWSPFDPIWYQQAFDKFISTADELFNQDEIIAAGYELPESDGSKSSVFHHDAVTNNSFDEIQLRETLKDIYLNSHNRLMAANHDNVHFFQYQCTMKDVKLIPNTRFCELTIPTESLITSRDKYKFQQFYRKWIPITDLLNSWDVFKFSVLLFINQKIYSEYELRMDDQETVIRFKYYDHWIDNDYTIYIYKFDTNAQCRVKVSKELILNQWNWKMPISYLPDKRILNSNKLICAFNKISDMNIRTDGITKAEVMGDNLEFLTIEDGYIDLSKCSEFNKHLMVTDNQQWIWMTIICPKFMHEFPILNPTDVIYRPYVPRYKQIKVKDNGIWKNVRTDVNSERKNVYINMYDPPANLSFYINEDDELVIEYNGNDDLEVGTDIFIDENGYVILNSNASGVDIELSKYYFKEDGNGELNVYYSWNDGWNYIIRPIVLSDAYDVQDMDVYDLINADMEQLRQLTIEAADMVETFRSFITYEYTSDDDFFTKFNALIAKFDEIHTYLNEYMTKKRMSYITEYEAVWEEFHEIAEEIISTPGTVVTRNNPEDELKTVNAYYAITRFHRQHSKYKDFWAFISPLIYIPREFADRYEISIITSRIGNVTLWEDPKKATTKLRFKRPVDTSDFWTFEYDQDDQVWRPYMLNIDHRFPDVYLLTDPNEETPTPNRVFKSFIFYSDTMNVREPSSDIVRASASWDDDMNEFEYDKAGSYRNIFMEKFYWMAVKTIYRGIMMTNYRWECIEYIQDNASYERFNALFLNTMEPYIKMGESTYLKSDDYGFLVDNRISKMNEYLKASFLGYNQTTGFEMYLNKTWKPSYYDFIVNVDDNFQGDMRLVRRPRSTFDTRRVIKTLQETQFYISGAIKVLNKNIEEIISDIKYSGLNFQIELLEELFDLTSKLQSNMDKCIEFVNNLDLDIYSIEDVNTIIRYIERHYELIEIIKDKFSGIKDLLGDPSLFDAKLTILEAISAVIRIDLYDIVFELGSYIQVFDIESFMRGVNNPEFFNDLDHVDDSSLIGAINTFKTAWPASVQKARNALYVSTTSLWAFYNPDKSYKQSEVERMLQLVQNVRDDMYDLETEVYKCWPKETDYEPNIVSKMIFAKESIDALVDSMEHIVNLRVRLFNVFDDIRSRIVEVTSIGTDQQEDDYALTIDSAFDVITEHLSYIAGENRKSDALEEHQKCIASIEGWITYVTRAKDIYMRLASVVGTPNVFLDTLAPYHEYLDALLAYMRTVDREFIPDTHSPTYSSVYQIDEIRLTNGGYNHQVGDEAYFENLGVYTISGTDGNINVCTGLEDPNLYEIDLSFDAYIDNAGDLILEVPNTPVSDAYINAYGNLVVILDDDSTSDIQNYQFRVNHDGYLYMTQVNKTGIYLNSREELIIEVDTDVDFTLVVNENGELILTMNEDDALDLELYRFYVTSDDDLMIRRTDNVFYRNTTFRDPCVQSNPYDSITSGNGVGITIDSISSTEIKIFNDSVITSYIDRAKNLLHMAERDMYSINPFSNNGIHTLIEKLNVLQSDWRKFRSVYSEYISPSIVSSMDTMIESLTSLIDPLNVLVTTREKNDLKTLVGTFTDFLDTTNLVFQKNNMRTPNYIYFVNRVNVRYGELVDYYGNGTTWNGADELREILDDCEYELRLFNRKMISLLPNEVEPQALYASVMALIANSLICLTTIPETYQAINSAIVNINYYMNLIPDPIRVDEWYRFNKVTIAEEGRNYQPGDIIEIIPALPKDAYGNEIHDNEDVIMSDKMFIKVTKVTPSGGVIEAIPIMEYAIPYQAWGVRDTITKSGTGEFLRIMVYSYPITQNDSTLFLSDDSYIPPVNQFDENDLFMFKFGNIHDLPIGYDIFFNGKQAQDVIIRHEHESNQYQGRDVDVIYLNANEVMRLADSSVFMENENYFVYKIDQLSITDPGAGYYEGQVITIDTGTVAMKVQVTALTDNLTKGIKSISMVQDYQLFEGVDPTCESAEVVTDSMNNIDDEYNSGYYDNIPADGILKPATAPYRADEYPFVSRRFEDVVYVDRNSVWMYCDVPFPEGYDDVANGDPDDHQYLGIREDNSYLEISSDVWNGIVEVIPVTDPFIPDEDRVPTGQPTRGEYQHIDSVRIHTLNTQMMDYIPERSLNKILDNGIVEEPAEGTFRTRNGYEYEAVPTVPNTSAFNNPTVVVDNEIIKAIDIRRIAALIRGQVSSVQNPGPYFRDFTFSNIPEVDNNAYYSNTINVVGDRVVETYASLPQHINEWTGVAVGNSVIVEHDETMANHRTSYKVRTFIISGYIVYDKPIIVDYEWNSFIVDWNMIDYYPDIPTLIQQYPSDIWDSAETFLDVQHAITDGKIDRVLTPKAHVGTYIADLTVDDLSVYNFTLKKWEDLHDDSKWLLTVNDMGFELKYLSSETCSYNMMLFLNKTARTQMKNAQQKRNAVFNISAEIFNDVSTPARNIRVDTGNHLRIRKMFPYEQKEEYILDGARHEYTMEFTLAPYLHFKNEIQVGDILIYNMSAGRFEDALDTSMFEIQIKDDKATSRGYETQTKIEQVILVDTGNGFTNGEAWAWNEEYGVHVFGHIETDFENDGHILKFIPDHTVNAPTSHIALEFKLYQFSTVYDSSVATVLIEFNTERVQVAGDGWLHNVTNPYAPIKKAFRVVVQYDYDDLIKYQIIINKKPDVWGFIRDTSEVFPTFSIPNSHIRYNCIYLTTEMGRLPLINPSTGKPSINVTYTDTTTEVKFLNIYHKYEKIKVHSTPYPMRSVYVQRRIPESGFIDLKGRINKPLNKKYFEFWMNGRLLNDEVTIISPTKIFLHGLKSLRNFEIIEINRDPNEYFSDTFLGMETESGIPHPVWNYDTYLDDALEGNLDYDNYTMKEQAALLSPVWPQVNIDDPEYSSYPANMDTEDDILMRIDSNTDASDILDMPSFQFSIIDVPTIEGVPVYSRDITFEHFGFKPITDQMIIDMLNEEWKDEIAQGLIPTHTIISDDDWYGIASQLYDEEGNLVHTLDEAAYHVSNNQLLSINTSTKISRITQTSVNYDLS